MRIAVVGGGIAGLAAAHRLVHHATDNRAEDRNDTSIDRSGDPVDVTVFERSPVVGGKVRGGPFAGLRYVDEGPDAFLARVPDATGLATDVGLGDALAHPEKVGAAVWHEELHTIPEGLVLGVPAKILPLARTRLLSMRGKARAALDVVLPTTSTDADSIGAFIRARLGDEVHERLVDALVGSIYAADTDHFSLAEVPQLAALTKRGRSLILSGRAMANGAGTAAAAQTPVFAAPRAGMLELCTATAHAVVDGGGTVRCATSVDAIEPRGGRWLLHIRGDDRAAAAEEFDAVILAVPAEASASLLHEVSPHASTLLRSAATADVAMITLHVGDERWPQHLHKMSGYLVPKPVQRHVTAVSFASQKWAHWQPPGGGQVLRVSIGRDGVSPLDATDDELVEQAVADVSSHLAVDLEPLETRVTRWPGAFAQYRPHHRAWVDDVSAALPAGVFTAGAAYNGIGIPACVRDGRSAADRAAAHLTGLRNSAA